MVLHFQSSMGNSVSSEEPFVICVLQQHTSSKRASFASTESAAGRTHSTGNPSITRA